MSFDSKDLVSSAAALIILRTITGRKHADRSSLKRIVDRGLITPVKIHRQAFGYDPAQVAAVAAKLVQP
jgi:hypothetical protein